ncbi:MAG: DNA replication/repair protein RecF [Vulcanimicrobiaceae bacterium]
MLLTRLSLEDVRNYASLEFAPVPGLNVLGGANAQGKSNLLEAIALLGTGKSFRTAREGEIVRDGASSATLAGEARLAAGEVRLSCRLVRGTAGLRKTYTVNGQGVRYAAYLGRMRVVTFVPAHLQLVSGPPGLRRALVNAALAQEDRGYYAALAAYTTHLTQKNALLRGAVAPDDELLATYNERLVEHGTKLVLDRRRFIAALDRRAAAVHQTWVGEAEGRLELVYVSNVESEALTHEAVATAFAERLERQRSLEFARRLSLVGPHRDDVAFRLDGRALATYGSQGQQRTAVLALKVAEYGELFERGGEAPILLLDDVLSELDAARRRAFLHEVGSFEQAFLTTAGELDVSVAAIYRVRAATVEAVA